MIAAIAGEVGRAASGQIDSNSGFKRQQNWCTAARSHTLKNETQSFSVVVRPQMQHSLQCLFPCSISGTITRAGLHRGMLAKAQTNVESWAQRARQRARLAKTQTAAD